MREIWHSFLFALHLNCEFKQSQQLYKQEIIIITKRYDVAVLI